MEGDCFIIQKEIQLSAKPQRHPARVFLQLDHRTNPRVIRNQQDKQTKKDILRNTDHSTGILRSVAAKSQMFR
jgi:hypothetical protein